MVERLYAVEESGNVLPCPFWLLILLCIYSISTTVLFLKQHTEDTMSPFRGIGRKDNCFQRVQESLDYFLIPD